jgi:transcriptional regulator with XRE-family HTH domain
MPALRDLDPATSVRAFFGAELRRLRVTGRLSQQQLAERISYSAALVGMVETARRMPSRDFAGRCDEALASGGVLTRLWPLVSRDIVPAWFRPWVEMEREASALCSFEPMVVPGLLQTRDYARALLAVRALESADSLEQEVAARLVRQAILGRERPPQLWCLIDEAVLHRSVGGPEVMREQLRHLAEMAGRPKISMQVLPFDTGAHAGLLGAFAIAAFENSDDIVYIETAVSGNITEQPSVVADMRFTYDTLRAEALPRGASRDLITKVAEERWT